MKFSLVKIACYCFFLALIPVISTAQKQEPVPIIFDSDMGPDFAEVGALATLHALADSGETKILATIGNNRYPHIAEVFDVINTYFDRPDLPIAIPNGASAEIKDWQGWSDVLVSEFPHNIASNHEAEGAVDLYRKILSQQPDSSVTIVAVGFMTNMANLLESKPDKYSKFNGRKLVSKKVSKMVSMAGKYPSGKEFNVKKDVIAADYVFENWPTKIIFSGYEIGVKVKTGIKLINNDEIQNNPIKRAYAVSIPQQPKFKSGKYSHDQTAVLVGVRGTLPYYDLMPGRNTVNSNGVNKWDYAGSGHFYLVEKKSPNYMQNLIDTLMQHQPKSNNIF